MMGRPTHVLELYGSTGWRGSARAVCGVQLHAGTLAHPPGIVGGMNTCLRCHAVVRARRRSGWLPPRWRRTEQVAPIVYVGHRGVEARHLASGLWKWTAGAMEGTEALRDLAMDAADREMLAQVRAEAS